jgi:HptB-dependent secretion and biofilm anti anti-sigma factor
MHATQTTRGAVLALNGEFELTQRDRLKDAFDSVVGDHTVVLDITKTAYIDSTILGSLLRFRGDIVRAGGTLILAGPSVMVQRLLDITMLTQLFDVRQSLAEIEGVAAFRRIEVISEERA